MLRDIAYRLGYIIALKTVMPDGEIIHRWAKGKQTHQDEDVSLRPRKDG